MAGERHAMCESVFKGRKSLPRIYIGTGPTEVPFEECIVCPWFVFLFFCHSIGPEGNVILHPGNAIARLRIDFYSEPAV